MNDDLNIDSIPVIHRINAMIDLIDTSVSSIASGLDRLSKTIGGNSADMGNPSSNKSDAVYGNTLEGNLYSILSRLDTAQSGAHDCSSNILKVVTRVEDLTGCGPAGDVNTSVADPYRDYKRPRS